MNLEERVRQLENELKSIKQALSPEMVANIGARLFPKCTNVTEANVDRTITITIDSNDYTAQVLDFPDKWVVVNIEGKEYLLAAYLLSRL